MAIHNHPQPNQEEKPMSLTDARRRAALEAEARRLCLDPVTLEMSEAVPTSLVRDIVNDSRRGVTEPRSMIEQSKAEPKPVQSAERPIEPRPKSETDLIDRLVEHFAGGPNKLR
jgi:hypothetical protein